MKFLIDFLNNHSVPVATVLTDDYSSEEIKDGTLYNNAISDLKYADLKGVKWLRFTSLSNGRSFLRAVRI